LEKKKRKKKRKGGRKRHNAKGLAVPLERKGSYKGKKKEGGKRGEEHQHFPVVFYFRTDK